MNKIKPSLNLLRPEQAFILKWLDTVELARLEKVVRAMSPAQYRLLKYAWGIGDGEK